MKIERRAGGGGSGVRPASNPKRARGRPEEQRTSTRRRVDGRSRYGFGTTVFKTNSGSTSTLRSLNRTSVAPPECN